jgi:hypothetical protein
MRFLVILTALSASSSSAQDLESMKRASELSTVLGSEKLCNLTLDAGGIERWISTNVAPGDLSFASQLQTMVMGQEFMQRDMSASSMVAHCAAVRQAAGSMGLIK